MPDLGAQIIELYRNKLADLRRRAAEAMAQLSDADLNWRPNPESNSIANLVLHLAGNLHQRVEAGIGGAPDTRNRDAEFNRRAPLTRAELLAAWHGALDRADQVLAGLAPARLGDPLRVMNRETNVLDVLLGVVTHMGEHVGQMLYIAKLRLGSAYQMQSVPHRREPA